MKGIIKLLRYTTGIFFGGIVLLIAISFVAYGIVHNWHMKFFDVATFIALEIGGINISYWLIKPLWKTYYD